MRFRATAHLGAALALIFSTACGTNVGGNGDGDSDLGDPCAAEHDPLAPVGEVIRVDSVSGGGGTAAVVGDDLIVIAGTHEATAGAPNRGGVLARISVESGLDPSFGEDGLAVIRVPGVDTSFNGVVLLSDGRLLAAGQIVNPDDYSTGQPVTARFFADGTVDTEFGTDGIRIYDRETFSYYFTGIYPRPGCGAFLRAYDTLAAIDGDGDFDSSFSGGIVAALDSHDGRIAVQADGKVLLSGDLYLRTGGTSDTYAVARYLRGGSLDTSFGQGGLALVDAGGESTKLAGIGVDSEGRIVATGGTVDNSWYSEVIRLLPDGTLDTSFGNGGQISRRGNPGHGVIVLPEDRLLAASGSDLLLIDQEGTVERTGDGGADEFVVLSNGRIAAIEGFGDSTRITLLTMPGCPDLALSWRGLEIGEACGEGSCAGGEVERVHDRLAYCNSLPGGSADQSSVELCDGLDNDCGGEIDEGLDPPDADVVKGVCEGQVKHCTGATGWAEPDYTTISDYEADETSCDGLDNDCDGTRDEGCTCTYVEGDGFFLDCYVCDLIAASCETLVIDTDTFNMCGCGNDDDCPCGMICGSVQVSPTITIYNLCRLP